MKILHTADLHLGKTLEGQSRIDEQEAVLKEIIGIIKDKKIDLLLIAGDIFDTFNPSAEAEGLYYDFLEGVTATANCAVVLIAGNHDQPERLAAAAPLAIRHSIYILAQPNTVVATPKSNNNPQLTTAGENWLELAWKNGQTAVIAGLPYISEGRIGQLITTDLADDDQSNLAYSKKIKALYSQAATAFRGDTINLVVGHLFTIGGQTSDSERSIQVGGTFGVRADAFPPLTQYVALGHLHRKQQVKADMPCYYSGSPLAYSFAEANQAKFALMAEINPEDKPQDIKITEIPLQSGCPLYQGEFEDYQAAATWCQDSANHNFWVNLKIHSLEPLREEEIKNVRGLHPRLLRIEVILPQNQPEARREVAKLSLSQRFELFVADKTGSPANPKLTELFLKLTEEEPMITTKGDDNNAANQPKI